MSDALLMSQSVDLLDLWEEVLGRPPRDTTVDAQAAPFVLEHHYTDASEAALRNFGLTLHARAAWARDGFPQFRLSQSLAAALLMTDSDSVPLEQVKFPFDTFVIQFSGPDYLVRTPSAGPTDPERDVVGVLVQIVKTPKEIEDYKRLKSTMLAATEAAKAAGASGMAQAVKSTEAGHALLDAIPTVRGLYMGLLLGPLPPAYMAVVNARRKALPGPLGMLPDGRHPLYAPVLSSFMEGREAETVGALLDEFKTTDNFHGDVEVAKVMLGIMHTVGRLVLNLALYITNEEDAAPRGRTTRAAPVRANVKTTHVIQPRVWLVGNEIKLPKEIREAARTAARTGEGRRPWHVSARFIVRGHFRDQPYGPGHSLRRKQWISPFWKGGDAPTVLARQYAVSEKGEGDHG